MAPALALAISWFLCYCNFSSPLFSPPPLPLSVLARLCLPSTAANNAALQQYVLLIAHLHAPCTLIYLARAGLQTLKACFRHDSLAPTERVHGAIPRPPPPPLRPSPFLAFLVLTPLVGEHLGHNALIHSHQELCSDRVVQQANALALPVLEWSCLFSIVGGLDGRTDGSSACSMAAGQRLRPQIPNLFNLSISFPSWGCPATDGPCSHRVSHSLRPLGCWDVADPCNFNFSCPTQYTTLASV